MSNLFYRILTLNNDKKTQNTLIKSLEGEEFEFNTANSADAGYQRILKRHYDLIISEIHFDKDKMTGLDLLQKIRGSNINIPFIIISDKNSVESALKAINFGVSGYLVKPIVETEARETIKRAIRHHKNRFVKIESINYQMENDFNAQVNSSEKSILKLLETIDNLIELVYPKEYGNLPDLKMAIYESLSNANEHGNKNDPKKNIFFRIVLKMDKVSVHIKDEGKGFETIDYENLAADSQNVNRGLNLIHHLMDEVTFNHKGNEINLLKLL